MIKKSLSNRIVAVLLIISGIALGATWNSSKFCIGDHIFIVLGLPAWSNGTSGIHYPAVIGIFTVLIGIGVLNATLQKKARFWVWTTAVLFLIIFNLIFSCQ